MIDLKSQDNLPEVDGMESFKYSTAIEKIEYRVKKLNHLLSYKSELNRFLTLPADNMKFEELLLTHKDFKNIKIDSYEIDKKTYESGVLKFKNLTKKNRGIKYYNDDVFNADFNKFDVIDLDLCGNFTIKLVNQLLSSLQNFKGGLVFLTVGKHLRGGHIKENFNKYGAVDYVDFRDRVFSEYIQKFTGVREYAEPYVYSNKSKSSRAKEMILYTFYK